MSSHLAKAVDLTFPSLVASDLISRGIDISHVSHVVSYDVPVDMTKYVHRVGRTARAGRDGSAWSLVEDQEARYFKNMLREAGHLEKVKRVRPGEKELDELRPGYTVSLSICNCTSNISRMSIAGPSAAQRILRAIVGAVMYVVLSFPLSLH